MNKGKKKKPCLILADDDDVVEPIRTLADKGFVLLKDFNEVQLEDTVLKKIIGRRIDSFRCHRGFNILIRIRRTLQLVMDLHLFRSFKHLKELATDCFTQDQRIQVLMLFKKTKNKIKQFNDFIERILMLIKPSALYYTQLIGMGHFVEIATLILSVLAKLYSKFTDYSIGAKDLLELSKKIKFNS